MPGRPGVADLRNMELRVIWLCAAIGGFIGSYVPVFWGASELSLMSILLCTAGAVAGVVVGARLAGV